ncbi:nephrin-like isoform X2 [Pecten maximus]|uniref:nephrin-like isoform X2 n=1 Tax=Pecten maximus TaxID=6579 RepID=UPI001458F6AB|nr:nephrin-like isoform X2 [Pecten maximus]
MLPKPPYKELSTIEFDKDRLFEFYDEKDGYNKTKDDVTVTLTSTNAELTINSLDMAHAGYYYSKQISGGEILGGYLLAVTFLPTAPQITPSSQFPITDSSVTLWCSSSSRSKPDNHGLVLTSTWELNGTELNSGRFSFQGTSLVINPVLMRDKYNRYTCLTLETGHGHSGRTSEPSREFRLTPRYGPQFITIEGAKGRSTLIWGDVYGPVVCKTDCNPPCAMGWRRQGTSLISPQRTTNNQLELRDSNVPRTREVTYTCEAGVLADAGFPALTVTKNMTVEVYFPPNVTSLRYLDEADTYQPVGTSDIRIAEGFSLVLSVDVVSNPNSSVILMRNHKTVAMGTVSDNGGRYEVALKNLQCNDTGRYGVRATNFVTQIRSNVNPEMRQFGLQVSCVPRRLGSTNHGIGLAGRKDQTISVNITVIANPAPTGQWSDGVRSHSVLQNNNYTYTVRGNVQVRSVNDYRKYHVNITNGIQGALRVTFQIRPEDVPDRPVNFSVSDVGSDNVRVMWTPGFDGGNPQQFHVDIMAVGKEWVTDTLNISDEGQGVPMTHTLEGLAPSTDYIIRLNVSNKIGKGNSSEISVRTVGVPVPDRPVDFRSSEVGYDYVKVMWTSGFNGGTSQLFHVDVMSVGDEWITDMLNICDKGQGVLMKHALVGLTPSTYYIIRLNVSNKVGRGDSTEISIRTRTIEPPTPVNLTVLILAVSVTLLLFVTGILGSVVTWQRRNQQGDTTRTEVKATNTDARNVNVSGPTIGGAAKCEAAATDDDGYTLTLEIPKGGAADYESLTTDDKGYIPMSKTPKGGASNLKSLTTDDEAYIPMSEITKDKNQLYDDISPA